LDTIDVSNLNRQFLFRREHVNEPKAKVVAAQIMAQNPDINIEFFVGKV
jgi:ubiquitin-like 1-activating enzyme E1 B